MSSSCSSIDLGIDPDFDDLVSFEEYKRYIVDYLVDGFIVERHRALCWAHKPPKIVFGFKQLRSWRGIQVRTSPCCTFYGQSISPGPPRPLPYLQDKPSLDSCKSARAQRQRQVQFCRTRILILNKIFSKEFQKLRIIKIRVECIRTKYNIHNNLLIYYSLDVLYID